MIFVDDKSTCGTINFQFFTSFAHVHCNHFNVKIRYESGEIENSLTTVRQQSPMFKNLPFCMRYTFRLHYFFFYSTRVIFRALFSIQFSSFLKTSMLKLHKKVQQIQKHNRLLSHSLSCPFTFYLLPLLLIFFEASLTIFDYTMMTLTVAFALAMFVHKYKKFIVWFLPFHPSHH